MNLAPDIAVPAEVRAIVSLSLLRLGPDTLAPRLVNEYRADWPPDCRHWLPWLADRMEMPAAQRPARFADAIEWADVALERASARRLTILPWFDAAYPELLAQIADPPLVLWLDGHLDVLAQPAVAVVGSRTATPAGHDTARRLGRELADAGLVVVSGMARGVDGAAHAGCLSAGGRSVAVLGSGPDVVYPPEHADLMAALKRDGAVISEFPPGMPPLPHHFPLRNRIISGLCHAVVVIEASEKSGSLITAKAALEQGRDVLAVPGSVASGKYRGSHALIKDGARLVESVRDVLDEIGWKPPKVVVPVLRDKSNEISDLEEAMAVGEPYSLEDLAERTGRMTSDLLAELGTLELAGKLVRRPGGHFERLDESATS